MKTRMSLPRRQDAKEEQEKTSSEKGEEADCGLNANIQRALRAVALSCVP
jgi:hypothetical protein